MAEDYILKQEEKEYFFPQQLILRIQTERQIQPLRQQANMFIQFRKTESSKLNSLVAVDTFSTQSQDYPSWQFAVFHISGTCMNSQAQIKGNWLPAQFSPSMQGLQLRYLILRTKQLISLKSLACEIQVSFRLQGDSTLWIITRAAGVRDPDGVVFKIKKEQDSQRVYMIFGAHVGKNHSFKFFKKQELPESNQISEESIFQDYTDIKLRFVDNGDDKVFVTAINNDRTSFVVSCNKYIPNFREQHLMIGGNGDSITVKNVSVKQVERRLAMGSRQDHRECCGVF